MAENSSVAVMSMRCAPGASSCFVAALLAEIGAAWKCREMAPDPEVTETEILLELKVLQKIPTTLNLKRSENFEEVSGSERPSLEAFASSFGGSMSCKRWLAWSRRRAWGLAEGFRVKGSRGANRILGLVL